jgi:uncharacterized membrane protein
LRQVQQATYHAGPLPAPDDLTRYEQAHPGLAERIVVMAEKQITMAERQMTHRHEMERVLVTGHNTRANLGLWLALVLAIAVLGSAVTLIVLGHDAAGGIIAAVDIVGLAGVFIYGRHDQWRREHDGAED